MKQKSRLKTSLVALSLIATGWCFGQNRWSTQTATGNDLSSGLLNNIFGTDGLFTPVGKRDIRFFAGGTHRMHLEGDPGPTYGFFGINDPLPNQRLTVTGGNINVRTATNGYMINSQFVLWHNGNVSNIFVGQFAGLTSTGSANTFTGFNSGRVSTGSSNTFSGFNAGRFNSNGNDNTYMGRQAGFAGSASGAVNQNTMIGSGAGQNNQAARHTFVGYHSGFLQNAAGVVGNTFIGWNAGSANLIGGENCFVGHQAGLNNTSSINTFIGFNCGTGNTTGAANTFLGTAAGSVNTTGNKNCIIGTGANMTAGNFNITTALGNGASVTGDNSAAIGAGTNALSANKMILGDNTVNVGIGLDDDVAQLGPQNKLEINTSTVFPQPGLAASGLRFRDLTSASPIIANPGQGVLAVNNVGDVIYVAAPTGSSVVGTCPAPLVPSHSGSNLNNFNFYFEGNTSGVTTDNSVLIGKFCGAVPLAKLDVLQASGVNTGSTGLYVENRDLAGNTVGQELIGIRSNIPASVNPTSVGQIAVQGLVAGDKFNIAIDGLANGTGASSFNLAGRLYAVAVAPQNQGVDALARGGQTNIGGSLTGIDGTTAVGAQAGGFNATVQNTGLNAQAFGAASVNYGIFTNASGATNNYGIFATTSPIANTGGAGPDYAGFFDGDLVGTTFVTPSDRNLKKDIETIKRPLDIVNALNPVTYNFDREKHMDINLPGVKQYGFISQEVKEILPELTEKLVYPAKFDSLGKEIKAKQEYLGLNYIGFIAILTKSIQDQQKMIEDQQKQIDELKKGRPAENNSGNVTQLNLSLSDKDVIVLDQNVPNPFAEQTVIAYNLPETTGRAQLLFYNIEGKLINSIDLTKGKGQVTVFAGDLSTGTYSYTLVVDGKIADTKKMVKTQ